MKTSSDEEKTHIIENKKHMKIFAANKQSIFAHRQGKLNLGMVYGHKITVCCQEMSRGRSFSLKMRAKAETWNFGEGKNFRELLT